MYNDFYKGCLIATLVAVIFGFIIGILFFLGFIPLIVIAIAIALGFATLILILLTLISAFGKREIDRCICFKGKCVLIATLGTILTATAALSIILIAGVIINAVLVGIVAGFAIMTIVTLYQLIACIIKTNCKCREME